MSEYKLTDLQEKWLQALESGEYQQGVHFLNKNGRMCCLGVACEVLGMRGRVSSSGVTVYGRASDTKAPPTVVKALKLIDYAGQSYEEFRVRSKNPNVPTELYSLAHANDSGATFRQIAAAIRANPENFFK